MVAKLLIFFLISKSYKLFVKKYRFTTIQNVKKYRFAAIQNVKKYRLSPIK